MRCETCCEFTRKVEATETSDAVLCSECAAMFTCSECVELKVSCTCLERGWTSVDAAVAEVRELIDEGEAEVSGEIARLVARNALRDLPLSYRIYPPGRVVEGCEGPFHVGTVYAVVTPVGYRVAD